MKSLGCSCSVGNSIVLIVKTIYIYTEHLHVTLSVSPIDFFHNFLKNWSNTAFTFIK